MTVEQFRNAHRALPFRPFTIRLADGHSSFLRHPDYLSHSPNGRTIAVYGAGEKFSIFDLLRVTELEFHAAPRQSGEAAA